MKQRPDAYPHDASSTITPMHQDRIVTDPAVLTGKPIIRGTRISVATVLGYLARTPDFRELFTDYPELTIDDVQACFAYAQALVPRGGRTAREPRHKVSTAAAQPMR